MGMEEGVEVGEERKGGYRGGEKQGAEGRRGWEKEGCGRLEGGRRKQGAGETRGGRKEGW